MDILNEKLPFGHLKNILSEMFGFTVVDESIANDTNSINEHYVIYDENGDEFYGNNDNIVYDLSTIGGIIRYAEDRGEKTGYKRCQQDIRKVLDI